MKRTLVAVALVIVFVMALAAPAFAQMITHSATYQMDGVINFKKQMGHLCNTGAEIKQTIMGSGQMDKVQTVSMVAGKITMKDTNDGVAGATPLTVTTVWELCAPAKNEWSSADYVYSDETGLWYTADSDEGVVDAVTGYELGWEGYGLKDLLMDYAVLTGDAVLLGNVRNALTLPALRAIAQGLGRDFTTIYPAWDAAYRTLSLEPLTDQIWAVQVQADPGYSLNVHQDGAAAHGPYGGIVVGEYDDWVELTDWTTKGTAKDSDEWKWFTLDGAKVGPDYVGNYFTMNQHARTSMGTLKRYIDISSPFSHGYLMEDMSVVGKSDVKEAFGMGNLPAGADVPGDWWSLF